MRSRNNEVDLFVHEDWWHLVISKARIGLLDTLAEHEFRSDEFRDQHINVIEVEVRDAKEDSGVL